MTRLKVTLVSILLLAFTGLATRADAALVYPNDLSPGDTYRLVFVTSEQIIPTSTAITDYDDVVTTAASTTSCLAALGATWKVIGSTDAVDAIDHVRAGIVNPESLPIYNLAGQRVADGVSAGVADNTGLFKFEGTTLLAKINLNETGDIFNAGVWTGSNCQWLGGDVGVCGNVGSALGDTDPPPRSSCGHSNATNVFWLTSSNNCEHILPGGSVPVYKSLYGISSEITFAAVATHSVGGNVSGLTGSGLMLQNNGGNTLSISANDSFVFSQALDECNPYTVTVLTQPSNPSQICTVTSATGTIAETNVTDVAVSCVINSFELAYSAGTGGTLSGDASQTVDGGEDGTPVTAVPDTNFHFVDWSDASSDNPRTDTDVAANIIVTANFAIDTFTVTPSVGSGSGSIAPDTEQEAEYNSTPQFVLTPSSGYWITDVGGSCGGTLEASTFTTDPVMGNCTVVANFELKPEEVFSNGFEAPPPIVFISSTTSYGNNIGGLSGADQTCNNLAATAGLTGTYAAWLSTTSPAINAKDRIGDHRWVRTDGAVVADNLADLIDGTLQNPINLDESGNVINSGVWTGTGSNGTFAGNGNPCNGWTGSGFGLRGNPSATDGKWSADGGLLFCENSNAIYCFGQ